MSNVEVFHYAVNMVWEKDYWLVTPPVTKHPNYSHPTAAIRSLSSN